MKTKIFALFATGALLAPLACDSGDGDSGSGSASAGGTGVADDGSGGDDDGSGSGDSNADASGDADAGSDGADDAADDGVDPCADVTCDPGESCLGGVCAPDPGGTGGDDGMADTGGTTPSSSDYGPCDMCAAGETPVQITGLEGCFCSPMCDGMSCPDPNEGTAQAACALGATMDNPTQCALVCDPTMMGQCPTGATCQDTGMMGLGLCTHPAPGG